MSTWQQRWVAALSHPDPFEQFVIWQEHWLTLHPEDTPPDTEASDDIEGFVDEFFHNLDKYAADPEVQMLIEKYGNVHSLEAARKSERRKLKR